MMNEAILNTYPLISEDEVAYYRQKAIAQVLKNLDTFTAAFPYSNSENQFYQASENVEWTTGFWTGQIWLAYEQSGNQRLLAAGNQQVESFWRRITEKIDVDHHDMGFLYSPSCVAAYQLTGNRQAREAALLAADQLMGRFHEKGQFFQAWGPLGAKENYRLIIDCLLNMPLLFWAAKETSDPSYQEKAQAHILTAMKCVLRPDNSTYHTYFFDPETGAPIRGVTHQGNRDGSAWARGQAWGIYGSAISYRLLRKEEYREIFEKTADYFLSHLPADLIPYWDFDFSDGSPEPRDSSAAAIAVGGFLEMLPFLTGAKKDYYESMAKRLMKALTDRCGVTDGKLSNGLLLHGTYARASVNNPCENRGVDECNTWGDYFYLEALTRLSGPWKTYW